MFVDIIPERCGELLDSTYNYLLTYGYINFGVALAIKDKIPAEPSKGRVIVIGAGLAGLEAARQLMSFGFEVIVLEGRKCVGGRVYTKMMEGGNKVAAADLGGSVLMGTLGNSLGLFARQLSYTLHKVRDECPLYRADGKPVDEYLDKKVEAAFNGLLDQASKLRQETSQVVPLRVALETLRKDSVGASGDDYDILAETLGEGSLFFAGEATTRRYPATIHGAFLTGLREAAKMAHHTNVRTLHLKVEKKRTR